MSITTFGALFPESGFKTRDPPNALPTWPELASDEEPVKAGEYFRSGGVPFPGRAAENAKWWAAQGTGDADPYADKPTAEERQENARVDENTRLNREMSNSASTGMFRPFSDQMAAAYIKTRDERLQEYRDEAAQFCAQASSQTRCIKEMREREIANRRANAATMDSPPLRSPAAMATNAPRPPPPPPRRV